MAAFRDAEDRGARRILIVGFGAIGEELADLLRAAGPPGYALGVLLRRGSPTRPGVPEGCAVLGGPEDIPAFDPALVVEAAGHGAVREVVPACLAFGLSVLISSAGALHDDALRESLVSAATRGRGRIILASGAIGGLDYVRAARGAAGLSVAYESRKPPAAWRAELARLGHDADALPAPVTLFEGDAREAAARYPANLNVAAMLALAGPGLDALKVRVVADPQAGGNTHVIEVASELGTFRTAIVNRPSPANPKTSRLVAHALLAAVEQYFAPVVML
jgi:aspartate dehydrogenase